MLRYRVYTVLLFCVVIGHIFVKLVTEKGEERVHFDFSALFEAKHLKIYN